MNQYLALSIAHRILQIQIVEPLIAKQIVVKGDKLILHKMALFQETLLFGKNSALRFSDDGFMNGPILALDDEKVGRVLADVVPGPAGGLVASDFELREAAVAVIIDLQPKGLQTILSQQVLEHFYLKIAVGMVRQIVEGTVLLGVGHIAGTDLFGCVRHAHFQQVSDRCLHLGIDLELAAIIVDDVLHGLLFRIVVLRMIRLDRGLEILDPKETGLLRNLLLNGFKTAFIAKSLNWIS